MFRFSTFGRAVAAGTFAVLCSLCLPATAAAQASNLGECTPAALDAQAQFFNGPGNYFTVAFNVVNVSGNACIPTTSGASPQFVNGNGQGVQPFRVCDACEDRLPNGQIPWQPPLLLNPGETGHQTYRWKTVPPSAEVACAQLSGLSGPALIVSQTLLPPVCSDIQISRYDLGAFPGLQSSADPSHDDGRIPEALVISTRKSTYYRGEGFFFHVALSYPGAGSPTREACPTLFLRQRGPDGATRLDETHPAGSKGCQSYMLGANRESDWQSGFEVDLGVAGALGKHSLELFLFVASPKGARIQFAHSNELKLRIEDPALISRKWGPKAGGVAVDVTLDKDTYQPGEDVALHIAIKNFDAPIPVYAEDPSWDPPAMSVQVLDWRGQLVPQSERSSPAMWMGHGRGPVLYPPGKLVPLERSLKHEGWLPKRPGTYTLIVSWPTSTSSSSNEESGLRSSADLKPYATAQAAATFRIPADSP